MKKRAIALLLCAALMLCACAFAEDVAGVWRPDEGEIDKLVAQYGQQLPAEMIGMVKSYMQYVYLRFDGDGSVTQGFEIPDVNVLLGAVAEALDGYEGADVRLGWSEYAGKLRLEMSMDGETEFVDLDFRISGDSLTVGYSGVSFRFKRASDFIGLAGSWELDLDALLQTFGAYIGDSAEQLKALAKVFIISVDLNSDGSIGLSMKLLWGTYKDGRITNADGLDALMRGVNMATDITYELDGDTLTVTTVTVANGESTTQVTTYVRATAPEPVKPAGQSLA